MTVSAVEIIRNFHLRLWQLLMALTQGYYAGTQLMYIAPPLDKGFSHLEKDLSRTMENARKEVQVLAGNQERKDSQTEMDAAMLEQIF
jgi:hypothetical protein